MSDGLEEGREGLPRDREHPRVGLLGVQDEHLLGLDGQPDATVVAAGLRPAGLAELHSTHGNHVATAGIEPATSRFSDERSTRTELRGHG